MTTTPRLAMTQLATSQANKEEQVNENDFILESFANAPHFKSRTTTAQPGSPSEGDCYLLTGSPTGTNWSTQANKIALYMNGAWVFKSAKEGFMAWVDDEDLIIAYTGSSWVVRGFVQQWDANFTSDSELIIYAHTADAITEVATTGTGSVAYQKSTAASPNTFASASSPFTVEAGAKWKIIASSVSGNYAVHLKRTV